MSASNWTNKNVSRIVRKNLALDQTWYALHTGVDFANGNAIECTEIEIQDPGGNELWVATDGGPGTDNIDNSQYWVLPAKSSTNSETQTLRITGITNTSQVSAYTKGGNATKIQYITRFYTGHVQTG